MDGFITQKAVFFGFMLRWWSQNERYQIDAVPRCDYFFLVEKSKCYIDSFISHRLNIIYTESDNFAVTHKNNADPFLLAGIF